ncbi:hypothetical protein ACFPJ1_02960 [Kribbella qitaiheensis]|uniref:hypothetical protein n=1 Tax=Kribbella qitaiheensis TaxID=1544730 RepID=UPI00361E4B66
MDGDRLVPRDSATYREFTRLYHLAQGLRPTAVDRWNRDLYATDTGRWGGFDPKTGSIRLSEERALQWLTGETTDKSPRRQAQALASVLHESTHAGMETDAPAEPNAVRSSHSLGLMEGFAEVRTFEDFDAFASRAGYPGLSLGDPQYPGAYAAVDNLLDQAAGPRVTRDMLIDQGSRGPGTMHFDQVADAVVRNRLAEVVPDRTEDRTAVRAALIQTMKHDQWPTMHKRPAVAGNLAAEDIRRSLNAKVDEIRHHYQANPAQPFPAESPNAEAARAALDGLPPPAAETRVAGPMADRPPNSQMRFLSGQAPAAQATRHAPSLGDGARGRTGGQVATPSRATGPARD